MIGANFIFHSSNTEVTADALSSSHCGYIVVEHDDKPHLYSIFDVYRHFMEHGVTSVSLEKIPELPCDVVPENDLANYLPNQASGNINHRNQSRWVLVTDSDGNILSVVNNPDVFFRTFGTMRSQIYNLSQRVDRYKRILDVMEDEVFITDEVGFITYINPRGEFIMGINAEDYIGKHISDLVHENILPKSITQLAIEKRERCVELVDLPTGIKIICSAQPIYDDEGNIIQILSTSKNIDEITDKIEELSRELDSSTEQIKSLQEQIISKNKYIFESAPMQQVQKTLMKVAPSDIAILIEGESGVGKEVIADTVYKLSRRSDKPFVKINCGLIPKDLMESELFGYEPGAFTGALKNGKVGKIEVADGGTVFLDEIGEMELALQVKLLEFLQDRKITRVGGTKRIPVDVRIIAATNRDLAAMVEEGTFRQDLYYRLNVMPVYIPPLRERRDDIVPMVFQFLNMFNQRYGYNRHIDNDVVERIAAGSWPGNVRELLHFVERMVVASDSDYIDVEQYEALIGGDQEVPIANKARVMCTELMPLKEAKKELESSLVKMAYEKFGSSYKAAEFLQVNQSTVSRWLKKIKE